MHRFLYLLQQQKRTRIYCFEPQKGTRDNRTTDIVTIYRPSCNPFGTTKFTDSKIKSLSRYKLKSLVKVKSDHIFKTIWCSCWGCGDRLTHCTVIISQIGYFVVEMFLWSHLKKVTTLVAPTFKKTKKTKKMI